MTDHKRMSPLTALVLGISMTTTILIISAASVVLYGMRIVDSRAAGLLGFAGNTIENLPELVESLPPIFADALSDRRALDYAANLDIEAGFVRDGSSDYLRPTVTITNNGDEVVSLLAVRVAALNERNLPWMEWTEVVATPLSIDNEWRGPLMPHSKRQVVLSRHCRIPAEMADHLLAASEISEIRVWVPQEEDR